MPTAISSAISCIDLDEEETPEKKSDEAHIMRNHFFWIFFPENLKMELKKRVNL